MYNVKVKRNCEKIEVTIISLIIKTILSINIYKDNFNISQQAKTIFNDYSFNYFKKFKQIIKNWLSIEKKTKFSEFWLIWA